MTGHARHTHARLKELYWKMEATATSPHQLRDSTAHHACEMQKHNLRSVARELAPEPAALSPSFMQNVEDDGLDDHDPYSKAHRHRAYSAQLQQDSAHQALAVAAYESEVDEEEDTSVCHRVAHAPPPRQGTPKPSAHTPPFMHDFWKGECAYRVHRLQVLSPGAHTPPTWTALICRAIPHAPLLRAQPAMRQGTQCASYATFWPRHRCCAAARAKPSAHCVPLRSATCNELPRRRARLRGAGPAYA